MGFTNKAIAFNTLIFVLLVSINGIEGGKLNFEDCRLDSECESDRKCLTYDGKVVACDEKYKICMCGQLPVSGCTSSRECSQGEHCAKAHFMPFPACTSCKSPLIVSSLDNTCPINVESLQLSKNYGLSGDYCKQDFTMLSNRCQGSRVCGNMYGGIYSHCNDKDPNCYCLDLHTPSCSTSKGCQSGERCIYHTLARATMCASCTTPFMNTLFQPMDHVEGC